MGILCRMVKGHSECVHTVCVKTASYYMHSGASEARFVRRSQDELVFVYGVVIGTKCQTCGDYRCECIYTGMRL